MHGLDRKLLEKQAAAIGLPLTTIELPEAPNMQQYDEIMDKAMKGLVADGYTHCAYGDIHLEDLRQYRDRQAGRHALTTVYPLWKRDTTGLVHQLIDHGFRAIVICANMNLMDETFLGREIDAQFLQDLPEGIDPCGENGEFHTFCFDGPIFREPVKFKVGKVVFREYPVNTADEELEAETVRFGFCEVEGDG